MFKAFIICLNHNFKSQCRKKEISLSDFVKIQRIFIDFEPQGVGDTAVVLSHPELRCIFRNLHFCKYIIMIILL